MVRLVLIGLLVGLPAIPMAAGYHMRDRGEGFEDLQRRLTAPMEDAK